MTNKEIQARNERAEQLKVLQADDGQFFVESGEGKILYKVHINDDGNFCTCGDFAKNNRKDQNFNCKHILSVMNAIPKKEVENARFMDRLVPKLDDRFLTNIKGKDFVLYAGVLDLANQKGLLKLEVELIQFPAKENGNEAICRAIAMSKTGELFSDIGDANPTNCHPLIAKHLIRMASTRAKGRALRDMCNIGIACLEELSDFDDVIGGNNSSQRPAVKKAAAPRVVRSNEPPAEIKPAAKAPEPQPDEPSKIADTEPLSQPEPVSQPVSQTNGNAKKTNGNGTPAASKAEAPDSNHAVSPGMSEAQKRAIFNLSRRRGISVEELERISNETFGMELESLTTKDASAFIRNLQQAA